MAEIEGSVILGALGQLSSQLQSVETRPHSADGWEACNSLSLKVFALPLSFISLIVAMATWPAVFGNTPVHLLLIAFIIALPALPAFASLENRFAMVLLGMLTVAAQMAVFAKLNLWF